MTLTCTHFTLSGRSAVVTALVEGLKIEVPSKVKLNALLKWEDILGANSTTHTSMLAVNDQMPLVIHTFEKARNGKRRPGQYILEVSKGVDQQDIDLWIKIITYFADPRIQTNEIPTMDVIEQNQPKKRNFLVVINPVSGQSKGEKLFKKVESHFANANINITKIITERSGHATEIALAYDLSLYDAMVIVGGDGLAYEVVQGFMQRPDWEKAIKSAFAVLPAGGGNGLAKTLTETAGEVFCFENCAYLIVKGQPLDLDLATIRNKETTNFIFLSLSWAFMADVDIESEKFRFAGSQRFALAALGKIMSGKNWSGTFSYLEAEPNEEVPHYWESESSGEKLSAPKLSLLPTTAAHPKPEHWKQIEGDFSLFWAMNIAWPGSDACAAPSADLDDGYMHVVLMPGKVSKTDYLNALLTIDKGTHIEKPCINVIKTRAFEVQAPESDQMMADGEKYSGGFCQVEVHRGLARVLGIRK